MFGRNLKETMVFALKKEDFLIFKSSNSCVELIPLKVKKALQRSEAEFSCNSWACDGVARSV